MSGKLVRVAFLTTSFPLEEGSVSGVFTQRLVKNLPETVHATVITPCGVSQPSKSPDYDLHCFRYAPWKWQLLAHQPGGIPVAMKRSRAMGVLLPVFLIAMFVSCFRASRKADIIHANWSVNGAIAGLIGFLLNKPVVTTLRGEDVTRAKKSKLYRYLLAWCLYSNFKVVAVSEAIRDLLFKDFSGYRKKMVFLPNGVESELFGVPKHSTSASNNAVFTLLSIGSLIPRKGLETIVEAFGYLQSPLGYRLVIVGDGIELNSLKNLVECKFLDKAVDFIGQVPPGEIINYFESANAFVLASFSEGRPNVVLESFAAGVPVIASDIDGVRELIQDGRNGMLFKSGDAESLAAKIEELKNNKELREKFSKNGRKFIIDHHLLWEQAGKNYTDLYRKAIDS